MLRRITAAAVATAALATATPAYAVLPDPDQVGGRVFEFRNPINDFAPTVPEAARVGATAVATDGSISLAVKDGAVYEWNNLPVPAEAMSGVTEVAVLKNTRYAIANGRVVTWGQPLEVPLPAFTQQDVVAMDHSGRHFLFLNSRGEVNSYMPDSGVPFLTHVPLVAKTRVQAISAGRSMSAVVKNGETIVWASGASIPMLEVPEVAKSGVRDVFVYGLYSGILPGVIVVKQDGSVWAWKYKDWDLSMHSVENLSGSEPVVRVGMYQGMVLGLTVSGRILVLSHIPDSTTRSVFPAARSGVLDFTAEGNHFIVIRDASLPDPDPVVTLDCSVRPTKKRGDALVCRGTTTRVPVGADVTMFVNASQGDGKWRELPTPVKVQADGSYLFRTTDRQALFGGAPVEWDELLVFSCYFDEFGWDWCPDRTPKPPRT